MQCLYCDSQVEPYPADGICPHCGAKLRPERGPVWQAAPAQPRVPLQPGLTCCPRCMSPAISFRERGFGWAAAVIGFIFLPPFGLLFGLIGRKRLRYSCATCGHAWRRK